MGTMADIVKWDPQITLGSVIQLAMFIGAVWALLRRRDKDLEGIHTALDRQSQTLQSVARAHADLAATQSELARSHAQLAERHSRLEGMVTVALNQKQDKQ